MKDTLTNQQNLLDRYGKIGASEVAGLLKDYSNKLLDNKLITKAQFDKLQQLPQYLNTKYSLIKKLQLTQQEFFAYSDFIRTEAMNRGLEFEEASKQDFATQNDKFLKKNGLFFNESKSQARKEELLDGVSFPFISTIDYILTDGLLNEFILEIKTTSGYYSFNNYESQNEAPFNYYIQVQCQMWMHNVDKAIIYLVGIESDKNQGPEIRSNKTWILEKDQKLIEAVKQTLRYFSQDYNCEISRNLILQKDNQDKQKRDIEIDSFLERNKLTTEIQVDDLLLQIDNMLSLESSYKKYIELEKLVKDKIKNKMGSYKYASVETAKFIIDAKYSKPELHSQKSIDEAIKKAEEKLQEAKLLEIGTLKSIPRFYCNINKKIQKIENNSF